MKYNEAKQIRLTTEMLEKIEKVGKHNGDMSFCPTARMLINEGLRALLPRIKKVKKNERTRSLPQ